MFIILKSNVKEIVKVKQQVNHGRPRRYYILGVIFFVFNFFFQFKNKLASSMLGQQILGMRAKKWGESMWPPSRRCIDPLKKILIKKTLKKKSYKKKYKNFGKSYKFRDRQRQRQTDISVY